MKYKVPYKINDVLKASNSVANTHGLADDALHGLIKKHFSDPVLWAKFVDQFRIRDDSKNGGWRGEYWGKMMRGASMVYAYNRDDELYSVLTESVKDILTLGKEDGRVSSYSTETEFANWDMWCRKYVVLGLEYYLEICKDETLCERIIEFLRFVADYIIDHIGNEDGKIKITDSSKHWKALNSCSILEPITKLYRYTADTKYLDFAKYIVDEGGARGINVFELAYEDMLPPYQYGAPKAYELMSCFEGLIEYALITGNEKYKTAAIRFAKKLMETDISVIGCCGVTHELLDHSTARQTAFYDGVSQETCVTVTWMKFCSRLFRLTGDTTFAEEMERSYYNAFLGVLNVKDSYCDYAKIKFTDDLAKRDMKLKDIFLPVDSYSPLLADRRGRKIGGSQLLSDGSYYGCCACISGAGIGSYVQNYITVGDGFFAINFAFNGEQRFAYADAEITAKMTTDYPVSGKMKISISSDKYVSSDLKIRIPSFAKNLKINESYQFKENYAVIKDICSTKTEIEICFDIDIELQYPVEWKEDQIFDAQFYSGKCDLVTIYQDPKDLDHVCVKYGSVVLAADSSLGKDASDVFDIDEGCIKNATIADASDLDRILTCQLTDKHGKAITLADYGTAGRDWKTTIAAWLKTK